MLCVGNRNYEGAIINLDYCHQRIQSHLGDKILGVAVEGVSREV